MKNDFADGLSPILVKELRQGMRSRVFVSLFILIQVSMILVTAGMLTSTDSDVHTALPWIFIGGLLLGVIPMMGFNAVQGEIKANTLDLLLLTRLTPWRIISGKWLALVLQGLLIVSTVLPLFVIRYFVGGYNLVQELVVLAWLVVGLLIAVALTVGVSGHLGGIVGRTVFFFVLFGMMTNIIPGVFRFGGLWSSSSMPSHPELWIATAFFAPLIILICFELGVSCISPVGVNRSTRRRLLVLLILLVGFGFDTLSTHSGYLPLALLCASPLILGALLEPFYPLPSLYRRLPLPARLRKLERPAAWFLLPGSGAGFQFSLLILAVLLCTKFDYTLPDARELYGFVSFVGAVYSPLLALQWFYRKRDAGDKGPWVIYGGLQIICFILAIFATTLLLTMGGEVPLWASLLPTTGFFSHLWGWNHFSDRVEVHLAIVVPLTLVVIGLLFAHSVRLYRQAMRLRTATDAGE